MRRWLVAVVLCGFVLSVTGCGGKEKEETVAANDTGGRTVNNNAPEAQNAPTAPHDPSIVYPGQVKKVKR